MQAIHSVYFAVVDLTVSFLRDSHAMFSGSGQHDAQELLKVLLVGIQEMATSSCADDAQSKCPQTDSGCHDERCSTQLPDCKGTSPGLSGCPRKRERLPVTNRRSVKKRRYLSTGHSQHRMTEYLPLKPEPAKSSILHSDDALQEVGAALFQGTLAYRTVCIECENFTQGMESFLDLSVPVVASHGFDCFGQQFSPGEAAAEPSAVVGPYSLSWALSQFARRERLRSSNKYWCGHCRHLVEAERSVLFSKLPPILTIHLNRFSMQSVSAFSRVGKITGNIATPLSLCLSPWCLSDCSNRFHMYALFAVVFHTGSSCHGGHYTACVRAKSHHSPEVGDKQPAKEGARGWLLFDDDRVVPITQAKLLDMLSPLSSSCATAYILFYA